MLDGVRSDFLADLEPLLEQAPWLKGLIRIYKIELVLDANTVYADIRYMAKNKVAEDYTTDLLELINAGTLIAHAPTWLKIEIQKHIIELANEGFDESLLRLHWARFEQVIHFHECGGPDESNDIDPKDVPYIRAQKKLQSVIYSADRHIVDMGGARIERGTITLLKEYSRGAAKEYTVNLFGAIAIGLNLAVIGSAYEFLKKWLPQIKNLSTSVVVCFVIFVAALLIMPNAREYMLNFLRTLPKQISDLGNQVLDYLEPKIIEYDELKNQNNAVRGVISQEVEDALKASLS